FPSELSDSDIEIPKKKVQRAKEVQKKGAQILKNVLRKEVERTKEKILKAVIKGKMHRMDLKDIILIDLKDITLDKENDIITIKVQLGYKNHSESYGVASLSNPFRIKSSNVYLRSTSDSSDEMIILSSARKFLRDYVDRTFEEMSKSTQLQKRIHNNTPNTTKEISFRVSV
ncbi:13792_t:CDS:2, partial [Funneliformis mosseae]